MHEDAAFTILIRFIISHTDHDEMCRETKTHSSVKCKMVDLRPQPDILDVSKQLKTSLIFHNKYWLDMLLLLLRECWLHYSKTDKPRSEVNKKDAKHLNQSTSIVDEERAKNIRVENVSDAKERITVRDVPEVSHIQSTVVHANGETLSPGKESDHSLVVDASSVITASFVSKENLHDFTDNNISTLEEQDFRSVIIDLDRNDGVPLQEVKSTNIAREAYSTFNTSLDLSDFDEDEFDGVMSFNLASIGNVNAQELRDMQLSPGCIQVSEETDDPIMFNIHFDEPRQGLNEQHNFLKGFDKQDDYSADECRGETKDDDNILETKLDSGLGDSIKTISVDCSSVSVSPYNKSEGYCASGIILEDASIKGKNENLSNEGTHIVSTPEEKIAPLFNTQNAHLWSYTNVTLRRNLKKETKWMLFRRRKSNANDSLFGYESYHSVEQSINDKTSSPLCEFRLKIRRAGDSDGNTSDCNKFNHGLSASRAKLFDIPFNEGSEKSVPVIILPSLHVSAIRFLCSVEYIVLPVSLKTYFNRVTEGTLTREEMMAYEWIRYASFNSFPRSIEMSTTRLANAGFYSTCSGTQASCFCCKVTHDQWSRGDDPYEVHRRISPNCPFLTGEAHYPQNIPIYQQDEQNTSRVNENFRHPMQAQYTLSTEIINPASAQTFPALVTDYEVENVQESLKTTEPNPQSSPRIEKKESSDRNHLTIQQNKDGRQYSDENQSMQNGTALPAHIDINRTAQSSRPENQEVPVSALECALLSIAQQPTDDAYNTDYRNPGNFVLPSRKGNVPGNQPTSPSGGPHRTTEYPKHSNYQMLDKRIQSFKGWPLHLDQTPQQMAEAGFFYVGIQDYVRCFQCGGGLKNFERGDSPWVEHTRWYPQCAYVLAKMGQRFVDAVAKKQMELVLAQQSGQNVINTSPSKSASLNQSDSSGSEAAQDSVNPNIGSPGKQASSNGNANEAINATSEHSNQSRLVYRNVDARLSGPVSLAFPVSGNRHVHLNGKSKEHYSQREALNVPEASSMPPFDPQSVIEEYSRLRNSSRCKVCQQRDAVIAFLPCGHLATCETCAPTLTACCVCQKKILASIKTYK